MPTREKPSLRTTRLEFPHFRVSFPADGVLLVTLDRPDKLNCIDRPTSLEMERVWELFDSDDSLQVGIITGKGRAFCTGADLHEWNQMNEAGIPNDMSAPGLGGLCRRDGKKPIIAAVNGLCMGGGFEMVANCDIVLASSSAVFSLPEVKRGIAPVAGSLPRLARVLGLQRTMDLALTGRRVTADELRAWGLVSTVVPDEQLASSALAYAKLISRNSPDSIIVARRGVRMAWEQGNVEAEVDELANSWYPRLMAGENFAEGIRAFVEKREPQWRPSKL